MISLVLTVCVCSRCQPISKMKISVSDMSLFQENGNGNKPYKGTRRTIHFKTFNELHENGRKTFKFLQLR